METHALRWRRASHDAIQAYMRTGACDPGLHAIQACTAQCTASQCVTQCATHLRNQRPDGADERRGGHHAEGAVEDGGGGGRTALDLQLEEVAFSGELAFSGGVALAEGCGVGPSGEARSTCCLTLTLTPNP